MKKLIFILFLFLNFNLFSQEIDYDLYVFIKSDSDVEISESHNDSINIQIFTLKNQISTITRDYSIDSDGKLVVKIVAGSGDKYKPIILLYVNEDNKNKPFIINKKDISNILHYPNDFYSSDINDIYELVKNSKNIFLIEFEDKSGILFAKKVELKSRLGSL